MPTKLGLGLRARSFEKKLAEEKQSLQTAQKELNQQQGKAKPISAEKNQFEKKTEEDSIKPSTPLLKRTEKRRSRPSRNPVHAGSPQVIGGAAVAEYEIFSLGPKLVTLGWRSR